MLPRLSMNTWTFYLFPCRDSGCQTETNSRNYFQYKCFLHQTTMPMNPPSPPPPKKALCGAQMHRAHINYWMCLCCHAHIAIKGLCSFTAGWFQDRIINSRTESSIKRKSNKCWTLACSKVCTRLRVTLGGGEGGGKRGRELNSDTPTPSN